MGRNQLVLLLLLSSAVLGQDAGTGGASAVPGMSFRSLTYEGTPTFSPGGGTYSSTQSVTISSTTPLATIWYNTTGTFTGCSAISCSGSTLYTTPVSVSASETLYAIATSLGVPNSSIGSAAYTITGGGTISWTLSQHGYNYTCGSSACTLSTSTTGTGTRAITTTGIGHFIYFLVSYYSSGNSSAAVSSSSASGDSGLTHCPTNWPANFNPAGTTWFGTDCYYVANSGADTSFTWTPTWASGASGQSVDVEIVEYARSSGTGTYDTGNVATATSSTCTTSCTAPSLSSFSGANAEVCVQWIASWNAPTAISGSYSNPTDLDSTNVTGAFAGNISVATTYTAPTWTISSSGTYYVAMGAACAK